MVLLLLDYLRDYWHLKFPAVFAYYSTRMLLAAVTSLLLSIFLGPFFIRKLYELKIGQTIRKEECPLLGKLHEKKQNTPTMGGILILFSMLISMLLWMDLKHVYTLILFITTIFIGMIGGRDDYLKLKYKNSKGMSAKSKLGFQLILSLFVASYFFVPGVSESLQQGSWFNPPIIKESTQINSEPVQSSNGILNKPQIASSVIALNDFGARLYIPFFKDPVVTFTGIGIVCAVIFMFLVIAGGSNAANLTDGLDGLAAGCLILAAACLALIAFISNNIEIAHYLHILYIEGSGEIAIYMCALVGACLGFLWYNSYPAQVFMGDTGSLSLGAILGVSAVLLKKELLLGIIGGIFVAEALSVILQVASYKLRNKKRIFLCAPLHHHFEYKGWPETKVVIRFWIIGLLLAIIGIATLKFQ